MGTRVRVLNIVTCSTMDVTGLPSLIVQLIPFYVCWYHHSWAHSQPKHTLSSFCLKVHYCTLYCLIKVSNQIKLALSKYQMALELYAGVFLDPSCRKLYLFIRNLCVRCYPISILQYWCQSCQLRVSMAHDQSKPTTFKYFSLDCMHQTILTSRVLRLIMRKNH